MMAFRRRGQFASPEQVVLVSQPFGVFVAGQQTAVESAVAKLLDMGGANARVASTCGVAGVAAIGSTGGALVATHGQYVRLTARSAQLLEEFGLVPSGPGSFWGFVRDRKRITGVLDFERVNLGPQRMMSLQTAAVSFALRAAIKEVATAVERVEGKVDEVLELMRSERLGDALGTRRMLEPLVARVRRDEQISTTDWAAVAGLGTDMVRDIVALRARVRSHLEAADGGWRPGDRLNDAERLFDKKGLLTESLALLIVAEHNLGGWHELRIAHVRVNEPEHLAWTIADAQAAVWSEYGDDQSTVDALRVAAERLTTPYALDGLTPWQRGELITARANLDDLAGWFADQRLLDLIPLGEVPYPSTKESLEHLGRSFARIAGSSVHAVRGKVRGRHPAGTGLPERQPDAP